MPDRVCAPELGLGEDLVTDFRGWVLGHGQSAYTAQLRTPRRSTASRASPTVAEWENGSALDPTNV